MKPQAPRPRGRPTDCTPEVTERVCRDLRAGLTVAAACFSGGITTTSYHNWRMRGETGEAPFADFLAATTEARDEGNRALELIVRKAAQVDWRAAVRVLESRDRENWSKRTEVTGREGGPVEVREVKVVLTTEAEAAIFDDEAES